MRYELNNEAIDQVSGGVILKMMPKHKTFGKSVHYVAMDDKNSDFWIQCQSLEAAQQAANKHSMSSDVVELRYD